MRSYKLDEFAAHSGAVNCLKIGRKSSGVLVTGGDDKKVNVWAIGKPNAILSLAGHQSAVECVNFDNQEETVAAGGQNGTVKVWDLNSTKTVRTLTGHRSSCLSIEFHPFGGFLASGSLDTNLKMWDLRRKDCIQTYKGHCKGVTHASISPDGRWVASGCENGDVKLWELSTGRLLRDFKSHDGRVTGLEFHPQEFLLATSSADRTICSWDLETWELVGSAGPEPQPVRAIHFHPDGRELLAATQDGVKVWAADPLRHCDTVPVPWQKVADMSVYEHRLIGCSFAGASVGVYVVDLKRVAPFSGGGSSGSGGGISTSGGVAEAAAAAVAQRLRVSDAPAQVANGSRDSPTGDSSNQQQQRQQEQQQQQPRQRLSEPQQQRFSRGGGAGALSRSASERAIEQQEQQQQQQARALRQQRSMTEKSSGGVVAPLIAERSTSGGLRRLATPPGDLQPRLRAVSAGNSVNSSSNSLSGLGERAASSSRGGASRQVASVSTAVGDSLSRGQLLAQPSLAGPVGALVEEERQQRDAATSTGGLETGSAGGGAAVGSGRPPLPTSAAAFAERLPSAGSLSERGRQQEQQQPHVGGRLSGAAPQDDRAASGAASRRPSSCAAASAQTSAPPSARSSEPFITVAAPPMPARFGSGGSSGNLRPVAAAPAAAPAPAPVQVQVQMPPMALPDPLVAAAAYRPSLRADLSRMLSTLQIAKGFVARGNVEGAYRAAAQAGDAAAAAMLLESLQGRKDAFDVSSTEALARALEVCLGGGPEHEHAAGVGLGVLGLVLRGPGQVIRDTLAAGAIGVDLNFEARRDRCAVAKMALQGLGMRLGVLARSGNSALAARAQQVGAELQALGA